MARISMTPYSMAPKLLPKFPALSTNWGEISLETLCGSISSQTSLESTVADTMSTETMSKEKISEEAISKEMTSSEQASLEECLVEKTSSGLASLHVESSKTNAEDTNTPKTTSTDIIIVKPSIPKGTTSNSKETLATLSPINSTTNPLIVPEAIFEIKSKPAALSPTGEASKSYILEKTLSFNFASSKTEFISSKAIVSQEISRDPKLKAYHQNVIPFDLSEFGLVSVQSRHSPKRDQSRRNIAPAHLKLNMNHRCWPPKKYHSGQKHHHPTYPSSTMTVAKLPMPNYQWTRSTKSLALRNQKLIRQTEKLNSISARSNVPTIMIPRVIDSTFTHANVRNPQFMGSNLLAKAITPRTRSPSFMAKTTNSKIIRKGLNPRFMARGMNPQLMATRMMNPNIRTARAMASRGTLPQFLAAKALTRQSLALVPRIPRKIVQKTLTFPGALRDDEALLPFKLLPSAAEERSLEKMEIWISTCPAKSIPAVIHFIKQHLIPRDISVGVSIRHLSRVRKTQFEDDGLVTREILLCAKESITRQELSSLLCTHTEPALHPQLAVASKWPAFTRKQYECFSKLWPVKGKPERKRALPRNISIQISEMKRFITAAIHLSQRVYQIQNKPPYNLPIATLIVDPSTSQILASTYDTRISTQQPLNHSVLTAINLLAISPQPPNKRDGYYAFGYDFYTTHEPCLMCCMAMTHSRARRCVFWKEMKYTGGNSLGWKELNHKYMIFQWARDESVVEEGVVEDLHWDVWA